MSDAKIAAVILIFVGVFAAVGIYYNVVEIQSTTSFAEVSGDFDSIQMTATTLSGGGFDKEETHLKLVSFESDETNKTFDPDISWRLAWSVNVYCFVNNTFETTHFDMVWNSTLSVQIHSSGVILKIARDVPISYLLSISSAERFAISALIMFVFSIPALFVMFDYITDRYLEKKNYEGFM